MPENKALYKALCDTEYLPLQFQPWWLDAVCGPDRWSPLLAFDGGGRICGVLPCYLTRRFGMRAIQLPPFTTYAGPWLLYPKDPDLKQHSRYAFEHKVAEQLIEQLPGSAFFIQNFRPETENWLPFYWRGFQQSTRYTYIFDAGSDAESLTAGLKNTLRSDLKKAQKAVECLRDDSAWSEAFRLHRLGLQRKGLAPAGGEAIFGRLHQALQARGQCACWLARGRADGRIHAALYLAHDDRQAAVLFTGIDPALKSSCAVYALWMEALRWSLEHGCALDFEGSMAPSVERTFRAFGARRQAYFQVWKAPHPILDLLFHLKRRAF